MEIIPSVTNIDFVGKRRYAYGVSAFLLLVAFVSFVTVGPRLGIDFTGGVEVQVRFGEPVSIDELRLVSAELDDGVSVQSLGEAEDNEFMVRLPLLDDQDPNVLADRTRVLLAERFVDQVPEVRRIEVVGPQVGRELRTQGVFAVLFALTGTLIYIAFRFEMRYALGAIAALVHDVFIVVGLFVITGREFSLPTIAALLTIIGYSLNDTIVVFDRLRENRGRAVRKDLGALINRSLNDTLSRTILTSGTTFVTVMALLFFTQKGTVIHDFAFALAAGVLIGTYSTVYVASPLLLTQERKAGRLRK